MTELSRLRMSALRLIGSTLKTPTEAVRWLLAVQAQDLPGAKWALGLRVRTWARTSKPKEIVVEVKPFEKTPKGFTEAVARYGAFVGKPVRIK